MIVVPIEWELIQAEVDKGRRLVVNYVSIYNIHGYQARLDHDFWTPIYGKSGLSIEEAIQELAFKIRESRKESAGLASLTR